MRPTVLILLLRNQRLCFVFLVIYIKLCGLKGFLVCVGPQQPRREPVVTSDPSLRHWRIMRGGASIVIPILYVH